MRTSTPSLAKVIRHGTSDHYLHSVRDKTMYEIQARAGRLQDGLKGELLRTKPSVLIISEDLGEIEQSERKFGKLGYDINIAKTLVEMVKATDQVFDLVMLSTSIKSFGLNFSTLLFKETFLLLVTDLKVFGNKQTATALLQHRAADGLVVLNS